MYRNRPLVGAEQSRATWQQWSDATCRSGLAPLCRRFSRCPVVPVQIQAIHHPGPPPCWCWCWFWCPCSMLHALQTAALPSWARLVLYRRCRYFHAHSVYFSALCSVAPGRLCVCACVRFALPCPAWPGLALPGLALHCLVCLVVSCRVVVSNELLSILPVAAYYLSSY